MKIAYLMNAYPMTSTTFIRREIEAVEERGVEIERFSVRTWAGKLVDPRDIGEIARTKYLLSGNLPQLIAAFAKELAVNPRGIWRALGVWKALLANARGNYVPHVAYLMQAALFRQLTERRRVEHVHVHFATNSTAVAMLAHLMGGPTYSFTVHGPDELVDPKKLSFATKIRYAAFVIAISRYCRGVLLRYAPPGHEGKISIARCGIPLEEFQSSTGEVTNSQTLVCVGRLCPQKGQVLIPKAAAALQRDFPNLQIILIGDGESRPAIEAGIAEQKVADIVQLKGWMQNESVLEQIKSSRALLLPSYAEGLPVVIMEALALGKPVISTTIAGIPELVDSSCGWLFEPGDERGLTTAMRAALECSESEIRRMGEVGRARVRQMHDRRKLAINLQTHFEHVLSASADAA